MCALAGNGSNNASTHGSNTERSSDPLGRQPAALGPVHVRPWLRRRQRAAQRDRRGCPGGRACLPSSLLPRVYLAGLDVDTEAAMPFLEVSWILYSCQIADSSSSPQTKHVRALFLEPGSTGLLCCRQALSDRGRGGHGLRPTTASCTTWLAACFDRGGPMNDQNAQKQIIEQLEPNQRCGLALLMTSFAQWSCCPHLRQCLP